MARPRKTGLEYFPHDTDAANDDKVQALMYSHGIEGYGLYFMLLERTYRSENGKLPISKFADKIGLLRLTGLTIEKFDEIVASAIEVGCFDRTAYKTEGCLTSNGILKRIASINKLREYDRNRHPRQGDGENVYPDAAPTVDPDKATTLPDKRFECSAGEKPKKKRKDECPYSLKEFEELWEQYPSKDGKKKAYSHFRGSIKNEKNLQDIRTALKNYLGSERVRNGYYKNGSTWFNNWKDWVNWKEPTKQESTEGRLSDAYKPL